MADEINIPDYGMKNAMPEAKNGTAGNAWVGLLRYHKSFTAKLLLSEPAVREYYAEIASELLSYNRVRSRTGWAGVTFSAGRTQLARCTINGKTLCLYLAADPAELAQGRYKARDAAATRKYEKTPALLRIRSAGSAAHAVATIAEMAQGLGLTKKDPAPEPISAKDFPQDSFQNLITRGLIRLMRGKNTEEPAGEPVQSTAPLSAAPESAEKDAYTDTVEAIRGAISRHAAYGAICEAIDAGDAAVKLSKRKMLRAIDEDWVSYVEDSLLSLDELIRSPSHYIAETEEILPMELTKKITGRSVVHLCQHTDYIASVEGDTITPSKLLNVFREDSVLTYENKFLNTLLSHLYFFMTTRYRIALSQGADEQVDELLFENHFFDGEKRGRIKVSMELCEKLPDTENAQKSFFGSGLWKRVERLNGVVKTYMESDFVRQMGRNYVKPPILRTNAILKNKYLRRCLDLWNFLEGYDESGVGLTVEETVCEPPVDYLCELSENAAAQYLVFSHHIRGGEEPETLAEYKTPQLHPNVRVREDGGEPEDGEFDVTVDAPKPMDEEEPDILFAVRVALQAAELYVPPAEAPEADIAESAEDEEEDSGFGGILYEKDFQAKIRLAGSDCRAYFLEIANALLSYRRVKMRISRSCCTFTAGRAKLAKLTVKGKTLYFYTALDKETLPVGFFARDVSDVRKYEATPTLLRVRSPRGLKNALGAVARLAGQFELKPANTPVLLSENEFTPMTVAEMIDLGWIRLRGRAELPAAGTGENSGEEQAEMPSAETTGEAGTSADIPPAENADTIPGESADTTSASNADAAFAESADGTSTSNADTNSVSDTNASSVETADAASAASEGGVAGDTPRQVDDLKSFEFGTGRDSTREAEHEADYFEHSPADPENYEIPDAPSGTGAKPAGGHLLSEIRYPGEMDYSRPTGKGVDDSSGFIQDSRESTGENPGARQGKRSLLDRLFGKKNRK